MENLQNCIVVDFGTVAPDKVHTKRIKISSTFLVKSIENSKHPQPLEEAFTVRRDPKFNPEQGNRFIVQYNPPMPARKSFAYMLTRYEDGSSQPVYIKGQSTCSDIEFSLSKVHFRSNSKIPVCQLKFTMENFSNCDDYFCWDFVPEGSEVNIVPHSGVIRAHSRLELSITFVPKKIGLFYQAFPCLFKFHELLYVDIFGFHSKKELKLDLNKYLHLNKPMPTFPTNYCRYFSDLTTRLSVKTKLPVTISARYIDFGRTPINDRGNKSHSVKYLTLTNNDEKDLMVVWSNPKGSAFRIDPSQFVLRSLGGSGQFKVSFVPTKPQIFLSAEIYASFLWGVRLEYKAPFCVTVHLIGDSFTDDACGWGPSYALERTRIVLPGTVPNIPIYTTFQIWKTGPLPIQFKMEPIDQTGIFVVKPREGVINGDFGLIVIQLLPQSRVDVLFKEEWLLTLNKFAQVKLEICGSCELPFLLAGDDKNVIFPATTLGAYSYLQVPIMNPTRLELEYRCLPCPTNEVVVPTDTRKIAPGETQFVDFGYRAPSLGTFTTSQGIRMSWAPNLLAAKKSIKGKDITSETVLRLTGTADKVRIQAVPDSLKMTNVYLNDTATGSFFLTNDGNTTAHIRLKCTVASTFSRIGEWTITPNDINLVPRQRVEVKITLKGVQVNVNVFEIQYVTYESHLFRIETSEWANLVRGEVFVFFSSLSVTDLRYDGLAKSLSKQVLWTLLRISKLNKILGNLETKPCHTSSMKIPKYHLGTPPLTIELLVKNTSPITLWLEAGIEKSCRCPPKKNDTISRRITDFSCPHDSQLKAHFDHRRVLAGETVVLTLLVEYEASEECVFNMNLFVSRYPEESAERAVVCISVDRGIIDSLSASSIDFLLSETYEKRSLQFSMVDVFIGDPSKYVQAVWMYNHSQKDTRYWAEWLYVNNRIFRILNSAARVAAYSVYPLFIEFTPFEMRTYEAKLAVVNELGEEFHITITARGSVCQNVNTIMILENMPLTSHFVDQKADIELSQSHIFLSPMPTHSFDKYMFFMKNNSKHTVCFSWERVVVWSTMEVDVQPKAGELQPGEIFPVQMQVHTFRKAAILNFVVECTYYNKTESKTYWEKCSILQKVTKNFDSCFVFKPDKEIGVAYQNPTNVLSAGDPPMNKIVSIGASIRIFNREHLDSTFPRLKQQLKFQPPLRLEVLSSRKNIRISKDQFYGVTEVLKVAIRSVVTSVMFEECIKRKRTALRYLDFPNKVSRSMSSQKIPGRQMSMLLSTILYSALMRLFGIEATVYHDLLIPVFGKSQQEKMFKMYNEYYERMLRTGIDQTCIPPVNLRYKRTQSRDQLAFVQRLSL